MENNDEKNNPILEIETEKEIFCLCLLDNNSKIAIGMPNNTLSIYTSDLSKKLNTINQPSYYLSELSEKTNRNGVKLLCCSYSYEIKIIELLFKNDKVDYNILYKIEPNESRNEISKAIELDNEDKTIVSIDEHNIIIYNLINGNTGIKYYETKKISVEEPNDILNINNNMFCVSYKNKGILQFYDNKNFNLIKEIKKVESFGCNSYICKLNDNILCIGGFNYISLIDINFKQINNKIELIKHKERITCTCGVIENRILIVGTKYKNEINNEFLFDIIIYELNRDNILQELLRFSNAHDKIINCIVYNNGYIISCSEDKKIKKWDLSNLINK